MTATAHVKTFLSWGHGLQNASSQVETRGSNSGFFEEYLSYKNKKFFVWNHVFFVRRKQNLTQIIERHFQLNYSVRVRDGFTLVCLMICIWRVNHVPDPVMRGQPFRSWIKNVVWCLSSLFFTVNRQKCRLIFMIFIWFWLLDSFLN